MFSFILFLYFYSPFIALMKVDYLHSFPVKESGPQRPRQTLAECNEALLRARQERRQGRSIEANDGRGETAT